MPKMIKCPHHNDDTASLAVYDNGAYCFGCGYRNGDYVSHDKEEYRYVEDIEKTIQYIGSLKWAHVRGLDLPCDDSGYYILWPTKDYYKFRGFDGNSNLPKYRGPSGIPKPLYICSTNDEHTLAVCEGEINALSLALVSTVSIVSPGGAGDFYSKRLIKDLAFYTQYAKIHVIVDADAAGTKAAIELKSRLIQAGKTDVIIHLLEKDFNDILVQDGIESLKQKVREMGL